MSVADQGSVEGGRRRPALRFAATVAVFALIGPIVGGLVVMIGFTVFGLGIWKPEDAIWVMLAMIVYGLWASYPFGIIPAVSVGALVALKDMYGGMSFGLACLFGAVAGAVWSQLAGGSDTANFLFPTLVAAGLVGTVVCWRLTRGKRRSAEAAS
ncbi:MAG: hypothetical protein ABI399_04545 [Bauldia sp.]